MNSLTININIVFTICLASQLVLTFAQSSSVLRVQRRVPDNALLLKESTTTVEPDIESIDDVFAIPIDDFRGQIFRASLSIGPLSSDNLCWLSHQDSLGILIFTKFRCRDYWYGRRLKKRSLVGIDEEDIEKRSQYQPWGGKRARYPDIFQLPKGFNPNGGKRSESMLIRNPNDSDNGRKRTAKTFQNWAGKRSNTGKSFVIWGGKKRADSFRTWGGKRADSFRTWGGKRADSFRTWGGK